MSHITAGQDSGAENTNRYDVEEAESTSLMHPRDVDDESFDN
jgi:hypothetical protein